MSGSTFMKNSRSPGSQPQSNFSLPQLMQPRKLPESKLRQALSDFLARASLQPRDLICPQCGQKMEYVTTTFSLYGSETSWQIRLPVCACAQPPQDTLPPNPIPRAMS